MLLPYVVVYSFRLISAVIHEDKKRRRRVRKKKEEKKKIFVLQWLIKNKKNI